MTNEIIVSKDVVGCGTSTLDMSNFKHCPVEIVVHYGACSSPEPKKLLDFQRKEDGTIQARCGTCGCEISGKWYSDLLEVEITLDHDFMNCKGKEA